MFSMGAERGDEGSDGGGGPAAPEPRFCPGDAEPPTRPGDAEPPTRASDAQLLARAGEDSEAFGVFYDRFERDVLAFFVRATGRGDVAADLTAEVFAAALASSDSYRSELGSARAWLFGIARHELADAWERGRVEDRARKRLGMEPLVLDDAELERIEELASADTQALALLEQLPDDQRVAISGRVLEQRGYAELAQRLSCSESVVRQRVSRGLRAMRARLEDGR
jgi:RNA polymerase sigma factor (sigma-70 family)